MDDDEARPEAAGHPALPPAVVTDLVAGADRRSAEAAAANPSLPHTVMTELLPPLPVRGESPGGVIAPPAAPCPPRARDRRTR
ncbi:hypothetical protein [Streptomyces globisporus]|uniref:hypothetical protein n=1 Tax=Streptomyces globisporus TaxID=1908 RepID=UPI000A5822F5|nr:hypothetical protein [Streptomyces globisporus]